MTSSLTLDPNCLLPEFCRVVSRGRFKNPKHIRVMSERLMRLAAGEIDREMTFLAPRHGKSQLRSVYFPAWWILNNPDDRIVICSNSLDLAKSFSRRVLEIVQEFGHFYDVYIKKTMHSAIEWGIEGREGSVFAVGVGGPLTGRGANLFLLDDPIKLPSEALSKTFRQNQWDWFASVADNRLEPDAKMCLTMTPWHADDIGGRILEVEPELWDVLRLPAIAEENDPLGRKPGEALWPERYSIEKLLAKKKREPWWFDAMFQCRPRPKDGGMFKEHWFTDKEVFRSAPKHAKRVRFWDKASTAGGGDWTVGLLMAHWEGFYWIEDVQRGQWGTAERDQIILSTCESDNEAYPNVVTWSEQEPGGGGKESAEGFIKLLAGYRVQTQPSAGKSKVVRAEPFANQCAGGTIFLTKGPWVQSFLKELTEFPTGKHDDQVDAASGAFNRLFLGKTRGGGYETNGQSSQSEISDHGGGYVT